MSLFAKKQITHEKFYIASFTKNEKYPYLVFVHGGPGLNCGVIEYLIENENFFNLLDYNIVFYDQRGCGRSSRDFSNFTHVENISDLYGILEYLDSIKINVKGAIGHSYGAKLLFDFIQTTHFNIQPIFVSTSSSILIPRLNNLTLDLVYLKKQYPEKYQETLKKMENFDLKNVWELTEDLSPLFQENKDRPYFYWANLDIWEQCKAIQEKINLPLNNDVFMSIRKNLYSDKANFSVDIASLSSSYLWINGFHDYINGIDSLLSKQSSIIPFFQSSHYPHIEENDRFCQLVNKFIKENYDC
jgi:proline iminopeptidase